MQVLRGSSRRPGSSVQEELLLGGERPSDGFAVVTDRFNLISESTDSSEAWESFDPKIADEGRKYDLSSGSEAR